MIKFDGLGKVYIFSVSSSEANMYSFEFLMTQNDDDITLLSHIDEKAQFYLI